MNRQAETRVAVIGGCRIPIARTCTDYAHKIHQQLMTAALTGLVERFGLRGQCIDDIALGTVLEHPADYDLACMASVSPGEAPGAVSSPSVRQVAWA